MATGLSTYQDIIDLVRSLIKDPAESSRLATAGQIDVWANSSLAEMAEHAEYLDKEEVYAGDLTGVDTIQVGDGGLGLWRVEIDDIAIYPTTRRKLNAISRSWESHTGQPRWYYLDAMRNLYAAGFAVGLWPTPSADVPLRIIYTIMPDELVSTSATDKVMLPQWCLQGLVWGILAKFYESESRMQNLGTAQFYKMLFDQSMERLRARSYAKSDVRKAWGEGKARKLLNGRYTLFPVNGVPYP